jgi:hypothetical protein
MYSTFHLGHIMWYTLSMMDCMQTSINFVRRILKNPYHFRLNPSRHSSHKIFRGGSMRQLLCGFLVLGLSGSLFAVTHSAWSDTIAWDAVTAVAPHASTHGFIRTDVISVSTIGTAICIRIMPTAGNGDGILELFNTAGKVAARFSSVSSGAIILDESANNRLMIPAGIYLARLRIGQSLYEKEFILAR